MKILRRAFILLVAAMALSFLILLLAKTGWADGIRDYDRRKGSNSAVNLKAPSGDGRQKQRPGPSYAQPFVKVSLLMGVPGALTLSVLAVARRSSNEKRA